MAAENNDIIRRVLRFKATTTHASAGTAQLAREGLERKNGVTWQAITNTHATAIIYVGFGVDPVNRPGDGVVSSTNYLEKITTGNRFSWSGVEELWVASDTNSATFTLTEGQS